MVRKSYSAQFKSKVVLPSYQTDQSDTETARTHDIHPNTLSKWTTHFEENGPEVFGDSDQVKNDEDQNVERRHSLLGQISPMSYLESKGISVENENVTLNWVCEIPT